MQAIHVNRRASSKKLTEISNALCVCQLLVLFVSFQNMHTFVELLNFHFRLEVVQLTSCLGAVQAHSQTENPGSSLTNSNIYITLYAKCAKY